MKTIKYLFIGAMMTMVVAPVNAQVDNNAVNQVKAILQSNPADAAKQINSIAKPFKKNAATLAAIAREYYRVEKTEEAKTWAEKALSASKNKCGDAWIVLGDIEGNYNDNGGKAAENYQQAIYMDPQNPAGYLKYAQAMSSSSLATSVDVLEQLGNNIPGYPWQIEAAKLCGKSDPAKAIHYYDMVDRSKMDEAEFMDYATTCFLKKDYAKSLDIVKTGIAKYPNYAQLYRLGLYATVAEENYNEAITYAKNLFAKADADKLIENDYLSAAASYSGIKDYANAKEMYKKAIAINKGNKDNLANALQGLADTYENENNFVDAIETYKKFLETKENPTASDYAALGSKYTYYASSLTGDEQKVQFANADKTFADLATKFADAAEYATHQRARIAGQLDPDSKAGLAKPFYDQLINIITTDGRIEGASKSRLIEAYRYNMAYSLLIQNNTASAKNYAAKILEQDPENEQAKAVSELK